MLRFYQSSNSWVMSEAMVWIPTAAEFFFFNLFQSPELAREEIHLLLIITRFFGRKRPQREANRAQQLLQLLYVLFSFVVSTLNLSDNYICFQVKLSKFLTLYLRVLYNSHNQQLFLHLVFEMETVCEICDAGSEPLTFLDPELFF